jgi:hypothetical protein
MQISKEEILKLEKEVETLKSDKFKQQMLPAWRPVPSFVSTIIVFVIFGSIFIAMGIGLYLMSDKIQEATFRYDDVCSEPNPVVSPPSNQTNLCT